MRRLQGALVEAGWDGGVWGGSLRDCGWGRGIGGRGLRVERRGWHAGSEMLEVRNTVILPHTQRMGRGNPYGVCNANPPKEHAGGCQFDELLLKAFKN